LFIIDDISTVNDDINKVLRTNHLFIIDDILTVNGDINKMSSIRTIFSLYWKRLDIICGDQGRIQDFKLGGANFKKLRRAEGGAKIFGVFRVKNHHFTQKKIISFPILGGSAPCSPSPPWIRPSGCRIILLPPPPGLQ
jgi:hypothetical protein